MKIVEQFLWLLVVVVVAGMVNKYLIRSFWPIAAPK